MNDEIRNLPTMKCAEFDKRIKEMLLQKTVHLDTSMRNHVDFCLPCWKKLVSLRWKIASGSIELNELAEFLGKDFIEGCDSSWELADEWNSTSRNTSEEILNFYKNTPWYIYNLTLWSATGQRPLYVDFALEALKQNMVKTILDFGSGVGTDALRLVERGFDVETFEINVLCNKFLEWRKKRRNLDITVNLGYEHIKKQFDALWAMDVIEHLKDPVEMLSPILMNCRLFIYDTEFSGNSGGRHPFHFQHNESMLQRAWIKLGFVQLQEPNIRGDIKVFAKM